eukprot:3072998-Rhodomonas_salina.1
MATGPSQWRQRLLVASDIFARCEVLRVNGDGGGRWKGATEEGGGKEGAVQRMAKRGRGFVESGTPSYRSSFHLPEFSGHGRQNRAGVLPTGDAGLPCSWPLLPQNGQLSKSTDACELGRRVRARMYVHLAPRSPSLIKALAMWQVSRGQQRAQRVPPPPGSAFLPPQLLHNLRCHASSYLFLNLRRDFHYRHATILVPPSPPRSRCHAVPIFLSACCAISVADLLSHATSRTARYALCLAALCLVRAYSCAMRSPVLTQRIMLRQVQYTNVACRATRCPVLTQRRVLRQGAYSAISPVLAPRMVLCEVRY